MVLYMEIYGRWEICDAMHKTSSGVTLKPGSACSNSRVVTTHGYGGKHETQHLLCTVIIIIIIIIIIIRSS
jgi:hypothetical protein